jgi:hypothetical protein
MAHIDPVSGQWVADDAGPVPSTSDAGSLGAQGSPALPPIQPQPPPSPSPAMVKIDEPINISAGPDEVGPGMPPAPGTPPAPTPVLPPVGVPPAARPQLVTSQKLATPEGVAALKNVDTTNAAIRDNTVAGGDLKVQQATQNVAQLDDQQALLKRQADEKAALQDAFERRQARDNELIAKAQADGTRDPDEGESWGHRLMRALAIGLGQYSAAMNHTENTAATIFENDYKQKQQRQKDKIAAAVARGKMTKEEGVQAQADLDAKGAGQVAAFNAKWKAESARLGIPQARIEANANTLALDKQEAEARAKLLDQDRITVRDMTPKELHEKKGGGAGGGSAKGIPELVAMKEQGKPDSEIAARAAAMNMKPKDYLPSLANVDKTKGMDAKNGTGGVDEKRIAYNADGTPAGMASTSRSVAQVNKDLRTLPRAIEQLRQLRENNTLTTTQRDPRFHNAVLAVAATTSAGSTDANVAHEKGTLTNVLGLPNNDAIDRKIAELENQLAAVQNQLEPLPEGYQARPRASLPDKARAARAVMNGEPAPAAPTPKAPKPPQAIIDQAKEEVRKNGPHAASAKRLLDQQGIDVP